MAQDYATHVNPEYVIIGNSAVMKCGVPSFVADFVSITGWFDEVSGSNFNLRDELNYGTNYDFQCGYLFVCKLKRMVAYLFGELLNQLRYLL